MSTASNTRNNGLYRRVALVTDPADPVAAASPVQWALGELEAALVAGAVPVRRLQQVAQAGADELCVIAAGVGSAIARDLLGRAGIAVAAKPESLALLEGEVGGKPVLLAGGHDARGLVYAVLELADRVRHAEGPLDALTVASPIVEQPANRIRAISRLFTSEIHDKGWFNDRQMWPEYLTMLASQRFNRFHLALGIGYDFLRKVTDAYFLFAYPFLLDVPGYDVRVPQLPPGERERNLDVLRYISEQTVQRGIDFQLGIWMHGWEWLESPNPNYTIEGLTSQTHGPYCRDAVRALLQACPAISGVTFRVHGESGVEEGSYGFWKTVFEGVATCGRTVEIDMHAKGMDQTMIDLALGTRQPVMISPKYWAEHMGMPYHQADIRELEQPRHGHDATGLMKFSAGSRSFTRYSYGDLLREDRAYGIVHRIWPGTQRLLIWGDPLTGAAHSRAFGFCGTDGVDIMEPLSMKGRRGSGLSSDRAAYADPTLQVRWDWQKYLYTYRVWGRLLYNPAADPDTLSRLMRRQFGPAAPHAQAALASASRILPTVTTAHLPSAANYGYWPEVYLNQPMIDTGEKATYGDTLSPKVFGNVSPLDPQLFYRINDFADDLLAGRRSGKYTPIEVAQWLEDFAGSAAEHLKAAAGEVADQGDPQWRRLAIDVTAQAGLGRFFGAKFRSGVLYRLFEQTGNRTALTRSLELYRLARIAWADIAVATMHAYVSNITVGENRVLKGHWADRLVGVDQDIAAMAAKLDQADPADPSNVLAKAIAEATGQPRRDVAKWRHSQAGVFTPGQPLQVELAVDGDPQRVLLHYRHVNHAERFETAELAHQGGGFRGAVPAAYTDSPFPLVYYFEVISSPEAAWLCPGLGPDLTDQPYFVVRPKP